MSIPKKIHYCWFGYTEKPQSVKYAIETWKKKLPDYEIIEWNESNANISNNRFAQEAYERRKWAFVSDYVRLVALTQIGGIYLDTDVEVLRSFDDLLSFDAVVGFEEKKYIMTAVLASKPQHPVFLKWLEQYESMHFILEDNRLDVTTNVHNFTDLLLEYGLIPNGMRQKVADIEVFPCDYFSPKNYYTEKICITSNSYTVHHFLKSWCEKESRIKRFLRMHPRIRYLFYLPNRIGKKILGNKYEVLKRRLKRL